LAEKIDADGAVIETKAGPKIHPAVKEELAGRQFIVRTLQALGLNLEPNRAIGRPTAWQKRQE
jgi:ribosomal protein L13E